MEKFGKYAVVVALLVFFKAESFSAERLSSPFILLDSIGLAKVKKTIQDGTASERTRLAYQELIEDAEQWLTRENPTVMDKTIEPPTGDKHDYLSISRYWWPDPETQDGLPWIRKDGQTNPDTQNDSVDRRRLGRMSSGVKDLSLAYYFSGDERYAQKATDMINTWFLNEDTRMNPNLEFAQSVPGNPEKRPWGMLDGRSIVMNVPDAIKLLSDSPHWTSDFNTKMNMWLTEYLTWLTESELGKMGETALYNNHGSWYKFQVAALALYLGNDPLVKRMVELAQQSIDSHLNDEGGQIHELARTRSYSYSCFNLNALTSVAMIGDKVGMDMWNYESEEGKSLSLAIDYLTPRIDGADWPHTSIRGTDVSNLAPILFRMSTHTDSDKYAVSLERLISILREQEQSTGSKDDFLQEMSLFHGVSY